MARLVRKVLPGNPGTKKLMEKYGDRLYCVRYRYDEERGERVKTVERIQERKTWRTDPARTPANKIVSIRIAYGEVHLGRLVKAAGGKWNRQKRVWELPCREVQALGLEERMV